MAGNNSTSQGFYGWTNVGVLAIVGVIGQLYIVSFGYFLPSLLDEFGWKTATATLASTINMIALGLCGPVAGVFIMKYGARRAIVIGNLIGFAGFLLLGFHMHLWQLFLGFGILIGTGAGLGGLLASTTVVTSSLISAPPVSCHSMRSPPRWVPLSASSLGLRA